VRRKRAVIAATPDNLCRTLNRRAEELGLSRYAVAHLAGLKASSVHRMMDGEFSPTFRNLYKVTRALGLVLVLTEPPEAA
jgi:DNA-binding phage protein